MKVTFAFIFIFAALLVGCGGGGGGSPTPTTPPALPPPLSNGPDVCTNGSAGGFS
jgi:hypothetical protein